MRISDWNSDVCSSDLILVRLTASTLSAPESSTIVSWVASASNLLGAVAKGRPVAVAASATKSSAKPGGALSPRSEEHTSELQSLMRISYAVFCLKKKKHKQHIILHTSKSTT